MLPSSIMASPGPSEKALAAVNQRIAAALAAAGRKSGEVTLLAVSKTFSSDAVRAAFRAGQREFGENYVQEAAAKRAALGDLPGLRWVLIGPLQSNKTALAASIFDRIESIDRLKIAQRLAEARPPGHDPLEVLVQVNISGEASKSGVAPAQALALAREVARLPRLRLLGFMGIAEPTEDTRRQRAQFRELARIAEATRAEGLACPVLSMGMSADLEAAIAEGSTEVRVGSALFGARPAGVVEQPTP